jgi:YD repeat-containing protein
MKHIQQPPIRNASLIAYSVYSHSGEFAPQFTDLRLLGRGLHLGITRSYRSSLGESQGDVGRGWYCSIARRLEGDNSDVIYHDGTGDVFRFTRMSNGEYKAPPGFYGSLSEGRHQYDIQMRYGLNLTFARPDDGGRIARIEDRNRNLISFSYANNKIKIIDTLERIVQLSFDEGRLQQVEDFAGRYWVYNYNDDGCLIEVFNPATRDFPSGTSATYTYDSSSKLDSITDAKGQTYLRNQYDDIGRVIVQHHGNGVFKFEYEEIGRSSGGTAILRTICQQKNGSKRELEHNEHGNAISNALHVRSEAFAPEDIAGVSGNQIPLVTRFMYNNNSELIQRIDPGGSETFWTYSVDEQDVRNQGNILTIIKIPQKGLENDQAQILTQYEYEPQFQHIIKQIDPRSNSTIYEYDTQGNLITSTYPTVTIQPLDTGNSRPNPIFKTLYVRYEHNNRGQLLSKTHADGTVTKYAYYTVEDPIGVRGLSTVTSDPNKICGYLARVVQDANGQAITNEYAYDVFGNATTMYDSKGNPAHAQYNAMGVIEKLTSREPFRNSITYRYDANYNRIESIQVFERFDLAELDDVTLAELREYWNYNALDNVTSRTIAGDAKTITEYYVRDANENVVRQIQPLGNTTEYVYDERNLLIEKRFGAGISEAYSHHFTYSVNGDLRTFTDGNGNRTLHRYDGYDRYKGFINPLGTRKTQWFDEAGNIVQVEINHDGSPNQDPVVAAQYSFDQWNRLYRVDKRWHDSSTGEPLGESNWDKHPGVITTIVEYGDNGLAGKIWTESDNVVSIDYDGLGRVTQVRDVLGEALTIEYDKNSNPIRISRLGAEVQGLRTRDVLQIQYDEMDRVVLQQRNDEAAVRLTHNALGNIIKMLGPSGLEVCYHHDSLGRRSGQSFTIVDPSNINPAQEIVRRVEYDDNYRISAYVDALGNRTTYFYDALDRQRSVTYPDGNTAEFEYDRNSNLVWLIDQNRNEIVAHYDGLNQLVERRTIEYQTGKERIEQYGYDAARRLVAASNDEGFVRRTYDSLSRIVREDQGDYTLQYAYDAVGNVTQLTYPSGEEVHKTYDNRGRVTTVKNKAQELIASFVYRGNDKIDKMALGDLIETQFSYNAQQRLQTIEHKRKDTGDLIEGFRYQYDAIGKPTQEIQLSVSPTFGERYFYDSADRAIKAQYGVEDVFDSISPFEQVTLYEYFPEGGWQRRLDLDGQVQVLDEQIGTIDSLNRYEAFGVVTFLYDAKGNCTRKITSATGECIYTYDQQDRLIKSECFDAQGTFTQSIEYFYDALGRQTRKVVTDQAGVTTLTYVWLGMTLLEEFENGVSVRTYIYSIDALPVQLTVDQNGRSEFFSLPNGRGLAIGLVPRNDPNLFIEKYGYELTDASFMKEVNGLKVTFPHRKSTPSSLLNAMLGNPFSSTTDWQQGTLAVSGGRHLDPSIAAMLNSPLGDGKTFGNSATGFMKEFNTHLGLVGFGNGGKAYIPRIVDDVANLNRVDPLVAADSRVETIKEIVNWLSEPIQIGPFATSRADLGIGVVKGILAIEPDKANAKPIDVPPEKTPVPKPMDTKTKETMNDIRQQTKDYEEFENLGKELQQEAAKKTELGDFPPTDRGTAPAYADPDQLTSSQVQFPTPQQLEARLMQNKKPMNPNSGVGGSDIDTSTRAKRPNDDWVKLFTDEVYVTASPTIPLVVLLGGGGCTASPDILPPAPEMPPQGAEISPGSPH